MRFLRVARVARVARVVRVVRVVRPGVAGCAIGIAVAIELPDELVDERRLRGIQPLARLVGEKNAARSTSG